MCENRLVFVIEIELRCDFCQIKICFVEALDCTDIFPVSVVNVRLNLVILYCGWNNLFAEVCSIIVENFVKRFCIENVNTH